jgi:hypothetical protein
MKIRLVRTVVTKQARLIRCFAARMAQRLP